MFDFVKPSSDEYAYFESDETMYAVGFTENLVVSGVSTKSLIRIDWLPLNPESKVEVSIIERYQ